VLHFTSKYIYRGGEATENCGKNVHFMDIHNKKKIVSFFNYIIIIRGQTSCAIYAADAAPAVCTYIKFDQKHYYNHCAVFDIVYI
jgi:hypothetical protein